MEEENVYGCIGYNMELNENKKRTDQKDILRGMVFLTIILI